MADTREQIIICSSDQSLDTTQVRLQLYLWLTSERPMSASWS